MVFYKVNKQDIPHSGLFSLGANFAEFYEQAHYLAKFIPGCYIKFDCESLLIYIRCIAELVRIQLCPDGRPINIKA